MNRLTFNVIIAGSRDFNDYEMVNYKKYYCLFSYDIVNSKMSKEDWI